MISFEPTDEQRELRGLAHEFAARELRPIAAEWDEREEYPPGLLAKAARAGLTSCAIPVEYGGGGGADAVTEYARGRDAFGRPILSRQGVGFKVADMAMLVEAARLLVWRPAAAVDPGEDAGLLGSYAKAFAADAAMRITTDAVQVLGGAGVMRDYPVEKWMRDAKVFQIVEGTSEVQRHIIAGYLRG